MANTLEWDKTTAWKRTTVGGAIKALGDELNESIDGKVSKSGDTVYGPLTVGEDASATTIDPVSGITYTPSLNASEAKISGVDIHTTDAGGSLAFEDNGISVKLPISESGTVALTSFVDDYVDGRFFYSRYYCEDVSTLADGGNGSGFMFITAKPKVFAMIDGSYITKLTIRTRNWNGSSQSSPPAGTLIHLTIRDSSNPNTILDTSDAQDMTVTQYVYTQNVTFTFSGKAPLNADTTYYIDFRGPDGNIRQDIGLRVFTTNPTDDYYLTATNSAATALRWRPVMQVNAMLPTETLSPFIPATSGEFLTNGGAVTRYLAATVDGETVGGPKVSGSGITDVYSTAYTLNKVVNRDGGAATTYKFTSDTSDPDGIVRTANIPLSSISVNSTALQPVDKNVNITAVTGAKGDNETTYRTGQVNITASNVGAIGQTGQQTLSGDLRLMIDSSYGCGNLAVDGHATVADTITVSGGVVISNGHIANNKDNIRGCSDYVSTLPFALLPGTHGGSSGISDDYELVRKGDKATTSEFGLVKIGRGLELNSSNQTVDVSLASQNSLGAVKVGSNLSVDCNGVLSVPAASSQTSGVVAIGNNISISNGKISVPNAGTIGDAQVVPGVVVIGSNITLTNYCNASVISVADADPSTKGVVQLENAPITASCTYVSSSNTAVTPRALSAGLRYNIIGRGSSSVGDILDRTIRHNFLQNGNPLITLPSAPSTSASLARDFIIDVTNGGSNTETIGFIGFSTSWKAVVQEGYDWTEMMTIEPGVMARFYFTETGFNSNGTSSGADTLPVFMVARQDVELVGVNS